MDFTIDQTNITIDAQNIIIDAKSLNVTDIITIDPGDRSIANYASIMKIDSVFDTLEISLNNINAILTNISGGQINDVSLVHIINELSANFYSLEASFNILDISNLIIQINELSEHTHDLSGLLYEISQNRIDITDLSNRILNISGSEILNTNEYVNDVSQTFYEIITQQPYKFDKSGNPIITSSSIILNWNYDKIIAGFNDSSYSSILSFIDNRTKYLPFIDKLYFEISGVVTGNLTGWIPYDNITVQNLSDYNTDSYYKTFTINKFTGTANTDQEKILSITDPFDIRVYGTNFANNYPDVDQRALIFNNISFQSANPPSQPINIDNIIESNSQIRTVFQVEYTENGQSNSGAVLTNYVIDYSQNEVLSSNIYSINSTDLSANGVLNDIGSNENFNIILNSLRSGTKYTYKAKVKNDLNSNSYSEYSDISLSKFTILPGNNGIGTSINININGDLTYITTSVVYNSNELYINLGDNQNIDPGNTSEQTIQISNPFFNNQQNTTSGYGKFIDNSLNLVQLTVLVDDVSKQIMSFDGSFSATDGNINKLNGNNFDFIDLGSGNSLSDIYNGLTINQGLRLQGKFKLNQILNNDISNAIGNPSINPYKLSYIYDRHDDVNNSSDQTQNYNIFVDNLPENPSISLINNSARIINVNDICYNMGIPSVAKFDLSFNRTYNDINSEFMYIRGDRKIAKVNSIDNTSCINSKNILLLQNDINSTGIYSFNDNSFDIKTGAYYNGVNYRISILSNDFSLNWNENVYNLKNNTQYPISLITNHYCDHNSFDLIDYKINACKLDLSKIHVYEISNIEVFESSLNEIDCIQYYNHEQLVKDYTLLFIDGKFNRNSDKNYPILSEFSYNNIIVNDFSAGNISYDLSGHKTNDDSGYKWIVFKIYKNPSNSSPHGSYIFNDVIYDVSINNGNKYLPLKSILETVFPTDITDSIFDINDMINTICFGTATHVIGNYLRFFNVKIPFSPIGGIWIANGSIITPMTYLTISNPPSNLGYGCNINNVGIYINPSDINNDLTVYIGIKNKIN